MRLNNNYFYNRAEAIDEVRDALDNSEIPVDVDAALELISEAMDISVQQMHAGEPMYGRLQSQEFIVMASLGVVVQVHAMTHVL